MKSLPFSILLLIGAALDGAAEISFNRDIQPILSDTCYHCHGPDTTKQFPKSKPLVLTNLEAATKDRGGHAAIVPHDANASELVARIFSSDPDEVMPPPDSNRSITDAQKQLLKDWIEKGAKYEQHWAFVPPVKAPTPEVTDAAWSRNPIDPFVFERLKAEGMQPNPPASPDILIRRATLSLTGLPPTPTEVDAFLADSSPDAYEKVLDRLLGSPRYGERMTAFWLEAARYADTDGYQNDGGRTLWPWRDWVIKAFNDNIPYDEFTVKQLAGDMLPGDDIQNVLASAFNRNHRINNEGGALPEEFIVEYAIDRVETTATVWMGLTAGCARCHDHKYDPISQKEFYQLYGYFNSISERGKAAGADAPPQITIASPLQEPAVSPRLTALRAELEQAKTNFGGKGQAEWEAKLLAEHRARKDPVWFTGDATASATADVILEKQDDGSFLQRSQTGGASTYTLAVQPPAYLESIAALRLEAFPDASFGSPIRLARSTNGNFVLSELRLFLADPAGKRSPVSFSSATANHSQSGYAVDSLIDGKPSSGWAADGYKTDLGPMTAMLELRHPLPLGEGTHLVVELEHASGFAGHTMGHFRIAFSATAPKSKGPTPVVAALTTPAKKRKKAQNDLLANAYRLTDPTILRLTEEIEGITRKAQLKEVNVLVMNEAAQPTPTYRLERGQYTNPDKSEILARGVPKTLDPGGTPPKDRLELARWLTSPANPLGARVTVNRIWQQHFGRGIVKSADNFGLQGTAPSHPDILDWLAVDFMEHGWDLKRLHKLILGSATWKQSSAAAPSLFERDPENGLLGRGPRFRLDGGTIRDSALAASGLLNGTLGGPPVKPYQPDGLWEVVAANQGTRYDRSTGPDLYRRSLYTYWKRAVNPPRLLIFDAATREYCSVARNATNTPLQALVLMNDITFLESARSLAERMLKEGGTSVDSRLEFGFCLALGIRPSATELGAMRATFEDFKQTFTVDPASAITFLSAGESPRDTTLDPVEHAAYSAAAHLVLNLDRFIHIE